ncbi:hypothetical protein [Rhodoflexus sp.]
MKQTFLATLAAVGLLFSCEQSSDKLSNEVAVQILPDSAAIAKTILDFYT